ncbi:MAG: hypothetical protein Tsb0016_04840 [Sphingomonadales bacterium]
MLCNAAMFYGRHGAKSILPRPAGPYEKPQPAGTALFFAAMRAKFKAMTRARSDKLTAVLGPTNTGKTHLAVERMMAHATGMMGFPLRLLAREVYDRVVAIKGASRVALITGEEKIVPPYADYYLCTVESMPLDKPVAFLAVDEIQLCADPERGHIFTQRLLHARGQEETMLLGAETMRPLIKRLLPDAQIIGRPRFSRLGHAAPAKLSRLPRRAAVVAFSAEEVYALAEVLRRQKGGAAIVMGALSPRTRNAQVALYQNGDVDYLVATDAIGMGLNMDIDHVAFAATAKYDGRRFRNLQAPELAQIAGRAGRYMQDGSFGAITGRDRVVQLDDDTVARIENHRFDPLKSLYWRQHRLDFASLDALLASLQARPADDAFMRGPEAGDLLALKGLAALPDIQAMCATPAMIARLWQICQIPDFRKLSPMSHRRLLASIFLHLGRDGVIADRWVAAQVRRLDNCQGDIDTLAGRIAGIRTWTYVAHQAGWLERAMHWAAETRRVEDNLSDALHKGLMQRFVDRRTSVLLREMRQQGELMVEISASDQGDAVHVEGHHIGWLDGFSFHVDPDAAHDEQRTLRNAAERGLRQEVARRAQALIGAGDGEITLDLSRGPAAPRLKWRGAAVAELRAGEALTPRPGLLAGSLLDGPAAQQVLARLEQWLRQELSAHLGPLLTIRETLKAQGQGKAEVALGGTARAVAYRLVEELGVLPRGLVEAEVRQLDQVARRMLRQFGVRFGASYVFIPALLKPGPTDWRLTLWALQQEAGALIPPRPTPGMVWTVVNKEAARGFYRVCGFKVAGEKAVRIDMLERLADAVRPLGQGGKPFQVSPELMGLVGLSGDDFAGVMRVLGYARRELPADQLTLSEAIADAAAPAIEAPASDVAADPPAEPSAEPAAEIQAEPPAVAAALVTAFVWSPKKRPVKARRAAGKSGPSGDHKPVRPDRAAKGDAGGDDKKARPPRGGDAKKKPQRSQPQPRPPASPHSPFAALAVLKEKMKS